MKAKISMITLGVADYERSLTFYRDGRGFATHGDTKDIAFFRLEGTWLAIYPKEKLAEDATAAPEGSGFRGFTLAHNVKSKEEVREVLRKAEQAGTRIVKPAQDVFWGEYSGYFADPVSCGKLRGIRSPTSPDAAREKAPASSSVAPAICTSPIPALNFEAQMRHTLQAATATEDITPQAGRALAGYHRAEMSKGVLDRLELSALVLRSDRSSFAWITADNIAFLVRETDSIRSAVAELCSTSASSVMLSFSHTHSGPEVDQDCLKLVAERSAAAIGKCLASLQPASIGWGVFSADANVNRRAIATSKAQVPSPINGPVDRRVGVLRIDDVANRPLAVLIRYSAHGTVLRGDNLLISADWPGALRNRLRPVLRCPVMVANGSAGDSNPRWRGSPQDLERVAEAIAEPVLADFDSIRTSADARVAVEAETITLDCQDLPDPVAAQQLADEAEGEWEAPTGRWRAEVSRRWQAGQRAVQLPVEVQVVQIGDAYVAGVPMETFTVQALDFAARYPNHPAFLNGYTNGWIGYLPGDEDLESGGYEVRWAPVIYGWESGWLTPIKPGSGKRLVEAAAQQVSRF